MAVVDDVLPLGSGLLADLDPAETRELVVDAWRMVVPQQVARAWDETHPDGP